MTIEQKKEWLYRYQNSQRRQKIILLQIEDARSRATSVQSAPGGVRAAALVHTLTVWQMLCSALTSCKERMTQRLHRAIRSMPRFRTAIEALPDIMQTMAVYYRYLQGMKIDLVCVAWNVINRHKAACRS